MDGTLIDTLSDIADSVNFVLNKYNFPQHSYAKYKIFIGDGIENLVTRALPKTINLNREQMLNEIRVQYQKNLNSKTVVYEGILEGKGYGLEDARQAIEIVHEIRNTQNII